MSYARVLVKYQNVLKTGKDDMGRRNVDGCIYMLMVSVHCQQISHTDVNVNVLHLCNVNRQC